MLQGISFRKPGFANSLILRIGLLILFALATFTFSLYQLIGRPTIDRLAEARMQLVSEQLESRVGRLLKTVEITLRNSHDWGEAGVLDHAELLRFNRLFFPVLANNHEIASVNFAHQSGREIFLLRSADGRWTTRLSDPQHWGRKTYWITWSAQQEVEHVEMRELDYDARTRPWFKDAMALPDSRSIAWTAPYIFYTTHDAGLTAAMRWQAADGSLYVIGHDVRLSEIAQYTTQLSLGTQGKAALITADGKLLAPPRDARFTDQASINKILLKNLDDVGLPDLAAAHSNWQRQDNAADQLNGFALAGSRWLSLFRPMDLNQQRIWIGVFAPKADFNPASHGDLALLGLITVFSLGLGLIVAIRIARRFGRPLQALATESERIGQQELGQPVTTDAPWREVTQLAGALENMRQHLQQSQRALQDSNIDLEQTVARRTQALHESQDKLQKREAIFRAIFDNATVGILSLDPQHQATLVNPAYANFIGEVGNTLPRPGLQQLLPTTEPERLQQLIDSTEDGQDKPGRSEFEFIDRNGESCWGDVQIAAVHNTAGKLDSLLVTVLDITDRREMESELIRQFALLQALLDTIPNPIFYKGADTCFLGCNVAYETFFGVDRRDFIGKRVLDLDYLDEAARQAFQQEDETVITECGRISREVPMADAHGQMHDTLYSVTGFHTTDGEPGGLIGVIVDITPLKHAEREAETARLAAEEAAAVKADFLANMSHEIRTPMNAIIGMTHLALQTELNARQRNYLSKVDNAAKGLLGIINDILDLSKIEAGKMLLEHTHFRFNDCLQNLADVCLLKASERNLELLFDIAPEVPDALVGDPLRLNQVLLNLVGNAIKFTEQGEVTLSVRVTAQTEDRVELHFAVSDTGIGLSEEQQKQLFTTFSQADTSTTRKYGGSGLGLSICKRIVEIMGGRIGVSSQPGVGSRFHFTLGFELAGDTASEMQRLGLPDQLNTLVIDDSPGARQIFRHLLLALGLPCHAVASGSEALAEMARANGAGDPYQLLIIDWKMPGLDGVETLHRLQQSGALQDAPKIVMTTAFDQDELRNTLGDARIDAILAKPVTPSSLFDCIIEALHADGEGDKPISAKAPANTVHFSGQRVLLVEDNDVNRELAEEMLSTVGLRVDTVENGQQAVDLLAEKTYDLVLMDCQMPVMDGYEATRQIRADTRLGKLPIIAMTANALAADRERCLIAGMDDHIAKPIDVALLYATLARWLKDEGQTTPPLEASPVVGDADQASPILDEKAALSRLGGKRHLFERLLSRFHADQSTAIERLQSAHTRGDIAGMILDAHTLRGLAGNIGADQLASAAKKLEIALKSDPPTATPAIATLISELATALQAVLELAGDKPSAGRPEAACALPEPAKRQAAFAQLLIDLNHDDASAVHHYEAMQTWLCHIANPALVNQLSHCVERYEFENAVEILRKIAGELSIALSPDPE